MSIEFASNNREPTSHAGIHLVRAIPKKSLWVFLYLIIISLVLYRAFSTWNYDDAYITYRYAANLAGGEGFVYNPGQRVLSTTTPLFTILLAAISLFWQDIPQAAIVLGVLGISLGTLFLWDLCLQKNQPIAGYACLVLYPTFPVLVTTIGLETPLYLAFCLGAIALYERRHFSWTAVWAGLACLARPDGILIPAVLTIHYLFTRRSLPPLKPLLIFSLLVLPWLLFSINYFGTPLPAALVTKQNQGAMLVSERFSAGLLTVLRPYMRRLLYIFEFLLGLVGLGSVLVKRKTEWTTLFAWTAAYFLAYTLLGVSRYPWYYAPLVPAFTVSIGLGLSLLVGLIHALRLGEGKIPAALLTVLVLSILGIGRIQHIQQIKQVPDQRRAIYRAVGEWLSSNTLEHDLVGTLEVGIIGFHSRRPMLDFAGLLQPEIGSRLGPTTSYADSAVWATEKFHPRYLVLQDGLYPALLAGYVSQNCELVKQFIGDAYDYPGRLDIFRCEAPGL